MGHAHRLELAVAILLALVASGCGGGSTSSSSNGSTTPPPSSVSVSISPTSQTVGYGASQQFTATVSGATNTAVTWTVSSASTSTQIGTISSSGIYTAPAATSVPLEPTAQIVSVTAGQARSGINISVPPLNSVNTVTVKATSQADTSVSASATVTLTGLSVLAVGQCTQSTASQLSCSAGSTGTEIARGQIVYLFVVGFGILPGTSYNISSNGTDVAVTQPLASQFQTTSNGTPVVYFQVSVSPGATLGPRNLIVRNSGNELTSFVGAVDIIQ